MDEDQLKERMRAAGIDPNTWGDMGGHGPQHPQFVLRIAGNLTKLSGLLEGAVTEKQVEIRVLEEKLLRLKYGGGS